MIKEQTILNVFECYFEKIVGFGSNFELIFQNRFKLILIA